MKKLSKPPSRSMSSFILGRRILLSYSSALTIATRLGNSLNFKLVPSVAIFCVFARRVAVALFAVIRVSVLQRDECEVFDFLEGDDIECISFLFLFLAEIENKDAEIHRSVRDRKPIVDAWSALAGDMVDRLCVGSRDIHRHTVEDHLNRAVALGVQVGLDPEFVGVFLDDLGIEGFFRTALFAELVILVQTGFEVGATAFCLFSLAVLSLMLNLIIGLAEEASIQAGGVLAAEPEVLAYLLESGEAIHEFLKLVETALMAILFIEPRNLAFSAHLHL